MIIEDNKVIFEGTEVIKNGNTTITQDFKKKQIKWNHKTAAWFIINEITLGTDIICSWTAADGTTGNYTFANKEITAATGFYKFINHDLEQELLLTITQYAVLAANKNKTTETETIEKITPTISYETESTSAENIIKCIVHVEEDITNLNIPFELTLTNTNDYSNLTVFSNTIVGTPVNRVYDESMALSADYPVCLQESTSGQYTYNLYVQDSGSYPVFFRLFETDKTKEVISENVIDIE